MPSRVAVVEVAHNLVAILNAGYEHKYYWMGVHYGLGCIPGKSSHVAKGCNKCLMFRNVFRITLYFL